MALDFLGGELLRDDLLKESTNVKVLIPQPEKASGQRVYHKTVQGTGAVETMAFGQLTWISTIVITNTTAGAISFMVRKTGGPGTEFLYIDLPANSSISIGGGAPIILESNLQYNGPAGTWIAVFGYYLY